MAGELLLAGLHPVFSMRILSFLMLTSFLTRFSFSLRLLLLLIGAAMGPFLTGILVPHGWGAVFAMLISADVIALVITLVIAVRTRNCGGRTTLLTL